MQELLLARVKDSCSDTLPLPHNPLKAATIALLQFKYKTSSFIIDHVWLRPELVASVWISLLSNQRVCVAINCLVLIQRCLEWMYITVQRLNPLKVNTMEKKMAKLLKMLLWKKSLTVIQKKMTDVTQTCRSGHSVHLTLCHSNQASPTHFRIRDGHKSTKL